MSNQNTDEVLQEIVRMARAGRDFYSGSYASVVDAETRTAFACLIDEKNRLVADLQPWIEQTSLAPRSSRADAAEKMYRAARTAFNGRTTANVAGALGFGEDQLLGRVERAFMVARLPALRHLLRTHVAQLQICRAAMWRLTERLAA